MFAPVASVNNRPVNVGVQGSESLLLILRSLHPEVGLLTLLILFRIKKTF